MSTRLLWLSANSFGLELLKESLSTSVPVSHIVTLSDGAETRMYDSIPVKEWDTFGIPVSQVHRIENESDLLRRLAPDLMIVAGWRQMIPKKVFSIPPKGTIGFHPTLLPRGRGPAPIINSILEGFRESGVTMFYLNDSVDAGDIIGQELFTIDKHDHASEVYEKVIGAGRRLVLRLLPKVVSGVAPRIPQDEARATYFEARSSKDNELLPTDTVELRHRKIRAFSRPYLGAYWLENGKKRIVWRIEELDKAHA